MRLIKLIFKIIFALFATLILFVGIFLGYSSIDKTDLFVMENAELSNPNLFKNERKRMESGERIKNKDIINRITGHRIKKGNGIVLGYRWYSNGSLWAIDDETYKKLTIWLPDTINLNSGKIKFENSPEIIAIYSRGGSAWPRSGCHGQIESGFISLKVDDGSKELHLTIDATISYLPNTIFKDRQCAPQKLTETFTLKKIEFSELTPWLGLPGKHIYEETYR